MKSTSSVYQLGSQLATLADTFVSLASCSLVSWRQWPHLNYIIVTFNLLCQDVPGLINLWMCYAYPSDTCFWSHENVTVYFPIFPYIITFFVLVGLWIYLSSRHPVSQSLQASLLFLSRLNSIVSHFKLISTFTLDFSPLCSSETLAL